MKQKSTYQLFCQEEKCLPLFFQGWYLDAVYDGQWEVVTVLQNQKIIAALPYYFSTRFGFRTIRTLPWGRTMGIYLKPEIQNSKRAKKIIQQLTHGLPRFHFFEQNFHPDFKNWLPLLWKNFEQTTRYTYVLEDIQNLENTWKNISSVYRNNKIQKAKNLLEVQTDLSLEKFFKIHNKSFTRQKIKPPFSFEEFQKIDLALAKNNARKCFFAVDKNNQIHSVVYLIWDRTTAYLELAGDDPNHRKNGAGMLLIWEAIRYASQELQLNRFDFRGSMLPNVEQVRRDFGATQIPYFSIKKFQPSFLKLIYDLRNILKS